MLVLSKNIELGLNEKSSAALRYIEVQKQLAKDQNYLKDNPIPEKKSSFVSMTNGWNNHNSNAVCPEEKKSKFII